MRKWGGNTGAQLRAQCLAFHGDVCWICGQPGADSADHVLPRSLGGADVLSNLMPAHLSCNQSRGNTARRTRTRSAQVPSRQW